MRKHLTLLALVLGTAATGIAQKEMHTMHLNALMQNTTESNSTFKLQLTKTAGNNYKGIIYDYSNTIKAEGSYVQVGKKYLEDGYFTYFYQDGKIESEGNYARGIKVGNWKRYDANGKRKADRYYPEESADKIRETMQLEKSDDEK
jgi:antitoxin component YwqK of YwqJK toxin-antitoxin module